MVENIVGKGENTGYQHFLLFPQCFQKDSLPTDVKSRQCVVKVQTRHCEFESEHKYTVGPNMVLFAIGL